MVNQRAQNLTLGTILLMLLGVVVVVILIWGFSSGWSNLWDKITGYGGSSNVDTIKNACALACSSSQKYAFCEDVRNVKKGDGSTVKGSCATLSSVGVASCSGISCDNNKLPKKCGEGDYTSLKWTDQGCESGTDKTSEIGDSQGHDTSKEKCCLESS